MRTPRLLGAIVATASLFGIIATAPRQAHAAVVVSVGFAPPPIPVYEQPYCPGDGYLWTPGYWAWDDATGQYDWVDGAWVEPPYVGALWTPGWWGWGTGGYFWHAGYWGRSIGYYGGINYGFGYFGVGFYGGYWNGGRFWYNRAYGRFHEGFRGGIYERTYAGFNGHPGGASFNAHPPAQFAGNGHGEQFNHGSSLAASRTPSSGFSNGGSAQPVNRGGFGGQNYGRPSAPAQNYSRPAAPSQNYSRPSAPSYRSSAPSGGSYSRPSAPSGGSYSGGGHMSAPSSGGASHSSGGHR